MTDIAGPILWIAIGWFTTIVFVARICIRSSSGSVGLPIAFVFSTTFLYAGFIAYLAPGYTHERIDGDLYLMSYAFSVETVYLGAQASFLGIVAFALGCWLCNRLFRTRQAPPRSARVYVNQYFRTRLMLVLGVFGLVGFLLNGVSLPLPGLQAVLQAGRNVAVAFVCLGAALVVLVDRRRSFWLWAAFAAAIPLAYLVFWGFTSYGLVCFTIFAAFGLAVLGSKRFEMARFAPASVATFYLLLSVFTAWMTFREDLRAVLWSEAGLQARVEAVANAAAKTQFLSPLNFISLDQINTRLNQYIFVGKTIEWHAVNPGLRLNGQTIFLAPLALVPRAMWPGKPEMGGSAFMANNTGMYFSEAATFGTGPVMEFYVNFGYVGVFLGFVLLGIAIRRIDQLGSLALREGRLFYFVKLFTAGIAFIAPLTAFFFMVNTALICWIVVSILGFALPRGRADGHIER